jgi:ribonuclease D
MSSSSHLLTTAESVDRFCAEIRSAGVFGIDTEFVGEHTYRPVLSLIQVVTPERAEIIDAQAVPELARFWELVADPGLVTVMHAAEQEARFCWYAIGALPENLVDVQLAAGLLGDHFPMSYTNLVQSQLNVRLRQTQSRTDWTRRPLSDAQLHYAEEDVHYLLPLWKRIGDRIGELGRRDWLAEENGIRADVLRRDLTQSRWWRVAGSQRLSRREMAAVREIYRWREAKAAARNVPRKRVLRDDLIISAAKSMPGTLDELRRMRGFERYGDRDVGAVLDCVAAARALSTSELPEARSSRGRAPAQARMLVLLLEAVLESVCVEKRVDAGLVGSASDLRDLVQWHLQGRNSAQPPALLQGWRATVCGDILEAALNGDISVRVANPGAAYPLAIDPQRGATD